MIRFFAAFVRFYRVDLSHWREFMRLPWVTFQALARQIGAAEDRVGGRACGRVGATTSGWDSEGLKTAGQILHEWSKPR